MTPLEELTLVKRQLEKGRLPFPTEAVLCSGLLILMCVKDVVVGESLLVNGSLILVVLVFSSWLIRRYLRSRSEWLQAVEAFNHYKMRDR
jgi:hypothetical protein